MLQINQITYTIAGRTIFEKGSARLPMGHKIGLVGPNGSGKTTLLRLVLGELSPDEGTITLRKRCSLGSVAQEALGQLNCPLDTVLAADKERARLLHEAEVETDPHQIALLHERLQDIDAHTAAARASTILAGLGFDEAAQHRPLTSFSGGWQMRVALACALFAAPDLLLLDEPTNHLDLESVWWLEDYLKSYKGTLLVVSHDRDFLNQVCTGILSIEEQTLVSYTGDYDAFLRAKAERAAVHDAAIAKQEARRAHLQAFVDRFKAKATKAKQAQSRIKALGKMTLLQHRASEQEYHFQFASPIHTPSPLFKLHDVSTGYTPNNPILKNINLSIYGDDRIALLGANGNGKSTLARLLAGQLRPFSGEVTQAGKLKIGYFAQDHLEQLNPKLTALEQMAQAMAQAGNTEVRSWLGRFGFSQERQDVLIENLSGGEKTRITIGLIAHQKPNLLILDEPTNHLDIASREALIDGINQFGGAVVLISHDRQLIEATCDQLWLVADGGCTTYNGDLEEYRTQFIKKRREPSIGDVETGKTSKKDLRRQAAELRAKLTPLKKRIRQAETLVDRLTTELEELHRRMADPAFYQQPQSTITATHNQAGTTEARLADAESDWMEATQELDLLESALATDNEH